MEMVNHHFHVGIQNIRLHISKWGSPNGKGLQKIPIWKWESTHKAPRFHIRITKWGTNTISKNHFEINSKRWPISIQGQFSCQPIPK
jgi:hypothetical protein